jgi:hypothetical protein
MKRVSVADLLAAQLFSVSRIAVGIALGVLLMWIGGLIAILGESSTATKAALVLGETGVAIVSTMLVGGGMANSEIEKGVRIAAVIMGVLLMITIVSALTGISVSPSWPSW